MITSLANINLVSTGKKSNLLGFSQAGLETEILKFGLPKFRSKQVWRWVWRHGVTNFNDMSDLGKSVREQLISMFTLERPGISRRLRSIDGTIKWLLKLADGNEVETVYIPEKNRGTLCISTQVGCTLNCSFCHTGTQKLVRNLSVEEICGQVV